MKKSDETTNNPNEQEFKWQVEQFPIYDNDKQVRIFEVGEQSIPWTPNADSSDSIGSNSIILGYNIHCEESNVILFGVDKEEVLKFKDGKMWIYGKENDCPQDLIDAMRLWLNKMNSLPE